MGMRIARKEMRILTKKCKRNFQVNSKVSPLLQRDCKRDVLKKTHEKGVVKSDNKPFNVHGNASHFIRSK